MIPKFAVDINLYEGDKLKGYGPLGEAEDAPGLFNKFLTNTVGLMTIIAFIWFIFLVISGAIGIMTAGGDKNAVSNSSKRITNGLIGLVVLISALFIIQLIGKLFGIQDVILNPADAILKLVF